MRGDRASRAGLAVACAVLRRQPMRVRLVTFALVALTSAQARAAGDATSPFEAKSTAVYAVFGLGTPVGLMGAEIEQTLAPNAAVSLGAGWGGAGPQMSAMLRLLSG